MRKQKKIAFPLKTIPDAVNLRSQLMQILELAGMITDPVAQDHIMDIVIVGGGPTGVETAGAIAELKNLFSLKIIPALISIICRSSSFNRAIRCYPP